MSILHYDSYQQKNIDNFLILNKIVDRIKEEIDLLDDQDLDKIIQNHLKTLCLIDNEGKWAIQGFEEKFILNSSGGGKQYLNSFINEVAEAALNNNYLMKFFEIAENENFPLLVKKVWEEGRFVFPDLICLMFVFDRLTKAMVEDYTVVQALQKLWKNKRKHSLKYGIFTPIKLFSVERAIDNSIKDISSSFQLLPSKQKLLLAINIMEAVTTDYFNGNKDNAYAGWALAVSTRRRVYSFDDQHKYIYSVNPHPKQWADLYTIWNLAFCSSHPSAPYAYSKLLIPQVNNYKDEPALYMFKRIRALYIFCNYLFLRDNSKINSFSMIRNWYDPKLIQLWGKINRECVEQYQQELRDVA